MKVVSAAMLEAGDGPLYPKIMAVAAGEGGGRIVFNDFVHFFSPFNRHLASACAIWPAPAGPCSSSPTDRIMSHLFARHAKITLCFVVISGFSCAAWLGHASAGGEPAADFLKRLRAARYFDTAIDYLDHLNEYPGVDPELISAIELEKAQTYIEAAVASRSAKDRDEFFVLAQQSLNAFLKGPDHPRTSEARAQLGKLQMVRATQYMLGEPDDAQRELARASYLAAAKTFDAIVDKLKGELTKMRENPIDPRKEPDKAALRDQYQFEYLQSQLNAADVRKLAAQTYQEPAKEGKQLLEQSRDQFKNLAEKYSRYVQGAVALSHLGQVYQELGDTEKATRQLPEDAGESRCGSASRGQVSSSVRLGPTANGRRSAQLPRCH